MTQIKKDIVTWLKQWFYTETETDTLLNAKQNTLVSGTNIKTVNGNSLLGSGNVVIGGSGTIDDTVTQNSSNPVKSSGIWSALQSKQDDLHDLDMAYDMNDNCIFFDDGTSFYLLNDNLYLSIEDNALYYTNTNGDEISFDDITLKGDLLDLVYPIGAIYMSVNSTSPQTLFGGTWVQLQDTFLYATSTTADTGTTAPSGQGEATHTLTVDEMPSHNHSAGGGNVLAFNVTSGTQDTTSGFATGNLWNSIRKGSKNIDSRGGGQAHNNMPPYMKVYMWKRTA